MAKTSAKRPKKARSRTTAPARAARGKRKSEHHRRPATARTRPRSRPAPTATRETFTEPMIREERTSVIGKSVRALSGLLSSLSSPFFGDISGTIQYDRLIPTLNAFLVDERLVMALYS